MSDTESNANEETTGADLIESVLRPQQWGLPLPEDVIPLARWGARAIYKTSGLKWHSRGPRGGKQGRYVREPAVVDLLHDRMSATGNNNALKLLGKWLDGTALPWLRKNVVLASSSDEVIRYEGDVVAKAPSGLRWPGHCVLIASPRASYDYLYIGAWIVPAVSADSWAPSYAPWRHGGWYVTNVRYPSGAVGCVSCNYPDKKWRIVCNEKAGTFPSRDAAARAERELAKEKS